MTATTETQLTLGQLVGDIAWQDRTVPLDQLPKGVGPQPSRAMIGSVRDVGILSPVLLAERARSIEQYEVLDGVRRIGAARVVGLTEIPARIATGVTGGQAVLAIIANEQRSANPVAEYAAIVRLADAQMSETEIARLSGMSVQTIRKRMRIRHILPAFLDLFEQGQLTAALAEELARLPENEQRAAYAAHQRGQPITHGVLRELRLARREDAITTMLPGIHALDQQEIARRIGPRDSALAIIERIRTELERHASASVIRAIDPLLGDLEGIMHERDAA